MGRLVLVGARHPGDVAVSDGQITAVGDVGRPPDDRVLDCSGDIITAGLISTHGHMWQWLGRGRAVGCNLYDWLRDVLPVWTRLSVDDVRAAARVGLAELVRSGATTVSDHHYVVPRGDVSVFDAVVEEARGLGVRLHLVRGVVDRGERDGGLTPMGLVEDVDRALAATEELVDRHHDGAMVSVAVGPASIATSTARLMVDGAELARRRGLRLHTHLAETSAERDAAIATHGRPPVELLAEWGWLHDRTWVAHGIHLDSDEVARLGAAGVGVAHCPSSNARLGSGHCPVTDLRAAGCAVGVGIDGAASNESGRLFGEIRQALYVARLRAGDAAAMSPGEALDLATEQGARCLGRSDVGRLEVGAPADLAVWPAADLADIIDPVVALVLAGDRLARHTVIDGRPVVVDGEVVGRDVVADRADLVSRVQALR